MVFFSRFGLSIRIKRLPCFSRSTVVKCLARNSKGNGNNDDTPITTISVLGPNPQLVHSKR